jgi:hypothetical protein
MKNYQIKIALLTCWLKLKKQKDPKKLKVYFPHLVDLRFISQKVCFVSKARAGLLSTAKVRISPNPPARQ